MPQEAAIQHKISESDRFGFTLFIALMLHGMVVLGISFTPSERSNQPALPSLDIILAQTKSNKTPEEFDYLAQNDQQGGGNEEEKGRPGAPFSADTPIDNQGYAAKSQEAMQQNILDQENQQILTQKESSYSKQSSSNAKTKKRNSPNKRTQIQLRIAKLQSEIKKLQQENSKKPAIVISASTKKAIEAHYLSNWVKRIERIGNINYPQKAITQKISGTLRLQVTIYSTGEVVNIKVSKSSGSSILDASAKQIVTLAAPFKAFPEELKRQSDHIIIIRTWQFLSHQQQLNTL